MTNPGSGWKEFSANEVLTASDVNGYLMNQSVLVFADTSAYTSSGFTPEAGAVRYVETIGTLELFTGSEWVPIAKRSELGGYLTTTKGDLATFDGDANEVVRLPVGANNYVLIADANVNPGLRWGLITNDSIGSNTITNVKINDSAAIADTKLNTISTADKVSLSALNIDGGTDIGTNLDDTDLIIVDDGGGGANKKSAVTRIPTYVFTKISGDITINSSGVASISAGAITGSDIGSNTITSANIQNATIVNEDIADNTIALAKLATTLRNYLVPAGTIVATVKNTADSGWLLMGQNVANANTLYPVLWDVVPSSWKSGSTTLVLPSMADRTLFGIGTTSLGALGGNNVVSIGSVNLPPHTHGLNGHTHSMNHTHSIDPPSTSVNITDPTHYHGPDGQYYFVSQINSPGTNATNFSSATAMYNSPLIGDNISKTSNSSSGITATVDITAFTSANSSISVTGGNTSSTTDGGFANTNLGITNAHLGINYQIKAH